MTYTYSHSTLLVANGYNGFWQGEPCIAYILMELSFIANIVMKNWAVLTHFAIHIINDIHWEHSGSVVVCRT